MLETNTVDLQRSFPPSEETHAPPEKGLANDSSQPNQFMALNSSLLICSVIMEACPSSSALHRYRPESSFDVTEQPATMTLSSDSKLLPWVMMKSHFRGVITTKSSISCHQGRGTFIDPSVGFSYIDISASGSTN